MISPERKIWIIKGMFLLSAIMVISIACKKEDDKKAPNADYIFKGYVKSTETNEPIKNIKVSIENFGNKEYSTSDIGFYYFEYFGIDITTDWHFKFDDIDSIENGSFENKDTVIRLNSGFLHDYDGNAYSGRMESEILILLNAKN